MEKLSTPYPENYPDECFNFWYTAGRPALNEDLMAKLPACFDGRKPDIGTVKRWAHDQEWRRRADELDDKALIKIQRDLVDRKVAVIKKQLGMAQRIQEKSFNHLTGSEGFDSSAAAVNAFFRAAELERKAVGLQEYLERIQDMSDEELNATIKKFATRIDESERSKDDSVIDVEPKEE